MFILFAAFLNLIFFQEAQAQVDLHKAIPTFEQKIVTLSKKKKIPGFAVGIIKNRDVIYMKGFGVRSLQTKAAITPATVFQLGSVSKTIGGTLIGILQKEGLLELHHTINTYLSDFTYAPGILTLKHILTHTSGIPRTGFNALVESEKLTREEIFKRLEKAETKCKPGGCYDYHNVMYGLSALVVEKVTQKTYENALKTYIFDPLHMKTASASYEGLMRHKNRALPHQKTKKGFVPSKDYRKGYYEIAAAGGINASLTDMCSFLAAQMGANPEILPSETLKILHTAYTPARDVFKKNPENIKRFKGSFYGIGWRILDYEGEKVLFHAGWVKGFINIIAFIPSKKVGIVILQNAETSFPWVALMTFVDTVLGIQGREWDKTSPHYKKMDKKKSKLILLKKVKRKKLKNIAKAL